MTAERPDRPSPLPCRTILVCFAVPEEAKYFSTSAVEPARVDVLLTGIGARNAAAALEGRLAQIRPDLVLTCGFAGALTSELRTGAVVYSADKGSRVAQILAELGAASVSFHCARRVATTAIEKAELASRTLCTAVDMESEIIRNLCRQRQIASATVRVISDGAEEDLPLDFNAIMTPDLRIDFGKLAVKLVRSPGKVPALLRFQRQTKAAAQALGKTLEELVRRVTVEC